MMLLLTAIVVVASEMKMNQKFEKVTMEDQKKKNRRQKPFHNINMYLTRTYILSYVRAY